MRGKKHNTFMRQTIIELLLYVGVVILCGCAVPSSDVSTATTGTTTALAAQTSSVPTRFAAKLTSAATAPSRRWFTWDADPSAVKYRIYQGNARNSWTNSYDVLTNVAEQVAGVHYGVVTVDKFGAESRISYWPLVAVMDTNVWLSGSTDEGKTWQHLGLVPTTNAQQLLRLEQKVLRHE